MRGIFWLAAKPVSFSRKTLLHGVSKIRTRARQVKWSQQFGRKEILLWNLRFNGCGDLDCASPRNDSAWVVTNFSEWLLALFARWKYPEDWECRFLPMTGSHIRSSSGPNFKKCSIRLLLSQLLIFTVGRDELWTPQIFYLFCSMSQLHETNRQNESLYFVFSMFVLHNLCLGYHDCQQ